MPKSKPQALLLIRNKVKNFLVTVLNYYWKYMYNRKYLIIFIVPAFLFITLFIIMALKTTKPQPNSTTVLSQTTRPTPIPSPTFIPGQSELQSLYNDINNLN